MTDCIREIVYCTSCHGIHDKIIRDRNASRAECWSEKSREQRQRAAEEANGGSPVNAHNLRVKAGYADKRAAEYSAARDRYDWELANEQREYPSDNACAWFCVYLCFACGCAQ